MIPFLLLSIGFLFVCYVRLFVYRDTIFAANDEARLMVAFTSSFEKPPDQIITSGPGTVSSLRIFKEVLGLEIISTPSYFGLVIGALYPFMLYSIYQVMFKEKKISSLSASILILSSYFLWCALENRPQLIGTPLLVLSVAILWRAIDTDFTGHMNKYLVIFLLLSFSLFFVHILSFLVLLVIGSCLIYYGYIKNRFSFKQETFLIIWLFFVFSLFLCEFGYKKMYNASIYMLSESSLLPQKIFLVNVLVDLYIIILTIVLLFLISQRIIKSHHEKLYYHSKRISFITLSKFGQIRWLMFPVFISILGIFVYLQFTLDPETFGTFYKDIFVLFLIFQLGNLLFAFLFFNGTLAPTSLKKAAPVLIPSLVLLISMPIVLAFSITLNNIAQNWLIRAVYFFLPFGAPVTAISIISVIDKWQQEKKYKSNGRLLPSVIVALIVVFSLISEISASRDPELFNNEYYWEDKDISAISWLIENGDSESQFYINNIKSDFVPLSKENSYKKLIPVILNDRGTDQKFNITFTRDIDGNITGKIFDSEEIEIYHIS